ncbi:hypothetical protein BIV57_20390 [Mangrovactinospora gilvigrisea]|uniref:DUF3817 domain-containing protein n=1 Tax=Mangrovactinospora gilvigrisea TaxID=1428644 RepID=A0A1J7C7P4_9ACTN|nr:DUF3817 domain-containing protein [Mangrovactinospora gilvigrisea]OIV35666.1 hypothetical protein BIV57_20390 [Mangrovactinospora gilvigrisea]
MKRGVLTRYRVMAYVTGVMLLALCGAMVNEYLLGNSDKPVVYIGMAHGYLFIVYLVAAFNLGLKVKWPLGKLLLVLVAGTIPICSFIAERKITREIAPRFEDAPDDESEPVSV